MKKNVVKIFFGIVIATLMLAMIACDGNSGGGTTPGGTTVKDCGDGKHVDKNADGKCDVCGKDVPKDGWEKIESVDRKDMYTKFLLGFTNVAYELSKDKVSQKKQVTVDGSGLFRLNDNDFYLTVKGKYDGSDAEQIREKTIFAVDVANKEKINAESRLFSLHLYKDDLYLAIGNNKVQFDIVDGSWTNYYPHSMNKPTSQSLSNLAGMFSSLVKLKAEPIGLTRRNSNKLEYKYSIDVDLKESLVNVFNKGLSQLKVSDLNAEKIKNFAASVFGITVEQLNKGEIPDSELTLEYIVSGEKIQSVVGEAEIDMSHSDSELIDGDKLKIYAEINDLKITNDYAQGVKIDFVNDSEELASYKKYSDAVYSLKVPIKVKGDDDNGEPVYNNYDFNVLTRIFQDNSKDNFIFLEYYNKTDNIVDRGLYVYDDVAYVVKNIDGREECIYQMNVDLSDLATRLVSNELNGTEKMDVYKLISYAFRSLAISESEIKFKVDSAFFTDVWYNFDDMLAYIEGLDESSQLLEIPEVKDFIDYVRTNCVYFTFKYDDSDLLKVIGGNDKEISKVVEKLSAYKATQPEESEKEKETEEEPTEEQ